MMKTKTYGKFIVVALILAVMTLAVGLGAPHKAAFADTEPTVLVLKTDKTRLWNNETATFTLTGASDDVEWYVNDTLQDGASGSTFRLENPAKGDYRVYAKSGAAMSNVCGVTSIVAYGDLMNKLHYVDGKVVTDNFDSYAEGNYAGVTGQEHFSIVKDGENGYLKSIVTEWGGSPWFGLDVGNYDLVDNYEVSFDVMYPEGVKGIVGFQIGGAVGGGNYEIGCINYRTDGTAHVYANAVGGQLINSELPALGGVNNVLNIRDGKWFRFRMVKLGSELYFFVDDTLFVQHTVNFNWTKLLGMHFIQFLVDGGVGICYDNLLIGAVEIGEPQDIPVTGMQLNAYSTEGTVGNVYTASVNWAPYNAKLSDIDWYVNDVIVDGQHGAIFNYYCTKAGNMRIQAKCGDIVSEFKVITVTELRPFEMKDTSDWDVLREENFDRWPAGAAWGANNPDVLKADGNGAVEHLSGEPYAKCGMFWDIGTGDMPIDYELSLDFNFKAGSVGYINYFIQGFFADSADKNVVLTVAKETENTFVRLLDEATGVELIRSDLQSRGGLGVDLKPIINYDEWHTLRMLKSGDGAALYIDDTLVGCTQFSRSSAAIAKYCIVITQFPDQPSAGCYIDNAKLKVEQIAGKDVETVTVSSSASAVETGASVTLTATVFPDTAEYESIKWYVNGAEIAGATGLEYTFTADAAGVYKVKCSVDGVESLERTVTVTAPEKPSGGKGDKGCNSSVGMGAAEALLAAFGIAGAVLIRRKRAK